VLVRDLLQDAPGEAIRYALLSAHYRKPLDWSAAGLARAKHALDRLYLTLSELPGPNEPGCDAAMPEALIAALEDDLNTPKAFAELFALARAANISADAEERRMLKAQLLAGGRLLGLLQQDPGTWLKTTGKAEIDAVEVERLIELRAAARKAKDFEEADRIRDQLAAEGVILEDQPGRTRWRPAG
jgi:cysteinyl-tRNA synthetase